jgi:large subunit ribosomal protein L22
MATQTNAPGATATVRYLHVSPYKIRQVLSLVRGLPVDDADRVLQLCEKDAADPVRKLLNSATANAEHNHQLDSEELFIARAWADEGPTRKWGQPRARGRYFRIRKRTSHVTIVLERFDSDELEERRRRDEASGRGAAVQQRRRAERVRRSRATTDEETATDEAEVEADLEETLQEVEGTAGEGAAAELEETLQEVEEAAGEDVDDADDADEEDEDK